MFILIMTTLSNCPPRHQTSIFKTPNYRYEVLEHKRTKKLKWKKEKKHIPNYLEYLKYNVWLHFRSSLKNKNTKTYVSDHLNNDLFSGCNFYKDQTR